MSGSKQFAEAEFVPNCRSIIKYHYVLLPCAQVINSNIDLLLHS